MIIAIADSVLTINNISVAYVPNSLKYNTGKGEKKVRSQASGGGNAQPVLSTDIESRIGKLSLSLVPTKNNIDLVGNMQDNEGNNAISLTGDNSFAVFFNNMAVVNDPDINISVDGVIDIELEGDPAV